MYRQIYNKILSRPIIVLAIVQVIFILIVFSKIIFDPNAYMFTNIYDGLKNYFTYTQFIAQEPSALGPWHFTQMNYPFGEYIFFTDNTPLLSMPLRWINTHIISIEGNSIAIHNYFFLFNLLCTPLLFYKLIEPYAKGKVLFAILLAIAFSWINPQILKLLYGVYNLSLSSVLLALILLFRYIHKYWQEGSSKEFIRIVGSIFTLIVFSAFAHIYYVPIIALSLGVFVFTLFIVEGFRQRNFKWKALFTFVFTALFGGLSFYFLIQFIDDYASLRRATASGFDWIEWKFTPEAIFSPYRFNSLFPIIKSCKSSHEIPSESQGFWGNFTWGVLLIAFLYMGYLKLWAKQSISPFLKRIYKNSFLFALIITAIVNYATASGIYIKLGVIPLSFDNVFSPFFYLYKHVDIITQFRCLGRFSWIGFWIVSILACGLFFKVYDSLNGQNKKFGFMVAMLLIIVLAIDTKDAMVYQSTVHEPNVFQKELLSEKFESVDKQIDYSAYQAIYTIPAVQVGSEDYNITIDDQPKWTEFWMQLSAHSGLPLFNCKMSRTAENQAKAQIDLLLEQKVPALILDEVNDKPVLVVYSQKNEAQFDLKVLDYARPAAENGSKIIKAFQMDTILVENSIYYLSWDIKNQN
ncbi:MAG: hypothetical protein ACI9O4_002426 [Chitinophagales bacterium]|jgi:hypothetical protein